MTFNYGEEKKRFDAAWNRTAKFYADQGMPQDAIDQMYEFDWNWFKAQRIEALHTQQIALPEGHDDDDAPASESPLLRKFFEQLTCKYDTFGDHSRYWWLEELSSPLLTHAIKKLTIADKELLTLYFIEAYTLDEIARKQSITKAAVRKRLNKVFLVFQTKQ